MDPLSVLSLVEACAGLAVTAGKLSIGLKNLADNYKYAALIFRSLAGQCKLFAIVVREIQAWMEDVPTNGFSNVDDQTRGQLADSLECAHEAILALERELVDTSKGTATNFWQKINVVWNLQTLKDLQDCIHKQVTGLGVILQIINLSTRNEQTRRLQDNSAVFKDSRWSLLSVRGTVSSVFREDADAESCSATRPSSAGSSSPSQLPRFGFDGLLLTSRAYTRNRKPTLALHEARSNQELSRDHKRLKELRPQFKDTFEALHQAEVHLEEKRNAVTVLDTRREVALQEIEMLIEHTHKAETDGTQVNTSQMLVDLEASLQQMVHQKRQEIQTLVGSKLEIIKDIQDMKLGQAAERRKHKVDLKRLSKENARLKQFRSWLDQELQTMYVKEAERLGIPQMTAEQTQGISGDWLRQYDAAKVASVPIAEVTEVEQQYEDMPGS